MNKFINSTDQITAELLEGYTMAFSETVKLGAENIVVRTHPKAEDKVAIIAFGGSGHEPAVSGFVGEGMLDASVVGDIFAAPGAQRLFQALQMFKRDAGILLLVLNHSGDVMSGNMAKQLAERAGIKVKSIMTHDDISAGQSSSTPPASGGWWRSMGRTASERSRMDGCGLPGAFPTGTACCPGCSPSGTGRSF